MRRETRGCDGSQAGSFSFKHKLPAVQLLAEAADKFAIHSGSILVWTNLSDFIRSFRTVPRAATYFVWLI